jgi:hypothetical protein
VEVGELVLLQYFALPHNFECIDLRFPFELHQLHSTECTVAEGTNHLQVVTLQLLQNLFVPFFELLHFTNRDLLLLNLEKRSADQRDVGCFALGDRYCWSLAEMLGDYVMFVNRSVSKWFLITESHSQSETYLNANNCGISMFMKMGVNSN